MTEEEKRAAEALKRKIALLYIIGGGGLFLFILVGRLMLAETLHTKTVILSSAIFFGSFGVLLAYVLQNTRRH